MSNFLRQLFEAAMSREANPYLAALGTKAQPQPPMQPMDVAGMASPQVGMGMALAQSFQQPLPQSPGEWWGRMQQQGQAMLDPSQAPLMLLGKIGPTPAAFSGALQGTKVLNKRGIPRMVFHGSSYPWEGRFDKSKIGTRTDPGFWGEGFYFGPPDLAAEYAEYHPDKMWHRPVDYAPNVRPAYLAIRNPLVIDRTPRGSPRTDAKLAGIGFTGTTAMSRPREFSEALRANGYDGVVVRTEYGDHEWMVLDSEQIIPAYGPKVGQGSFQRATK